MLDEHILEQFKQFFQSKIESQLLEIDDIDAVIVKARNFGTAILKWNFHKLLVIPYAST